MTIAGIASSLGGSFLRALSTEPAEESITSTDPNGASSTSGAVTPEEDSGPAAGEFDSLLTSFLPGKVGKKVSEEELFAAAVGERISSLKGADALEKYKSTLVAMQGPATGADGYVSYEQITVDALQQMVSKGDLTESEGDRLYTEAFLGSQLDGNSSALYDDRGGTGDTTVAVEAMDVALAKYQDFITGLGGAAPSTLMSLSPASSTGSVSSAHLGTTDSWFTTSPGGEVTPEGTYVDGADGFLFKPVSNNEGTLAVLLGQSWTGNIEGVALKDALGNLIESGHNSGAAGTAETGREKWVFSKPGGSYSGDLEVAVTFKDGAVQSFRIPDPSQRYD